MKNYQGWLLVCLVAGAGCKGAAAAEESKKGPASAAIDELVQHQEGPDGLTWKRAELPWGSVELPDGNGWTLNPVRGGVLVTSKSAASFVGAGNIDETLAEVLRQTERDHTTQYKDFTGDMPLRGTVKGAKARAIEGTVNGGASVSYELLVEAGPNHTLDFNAFGAAADTAQLRLIVQHMAASMHVKQ